MSLFKKILFSILVVIDLYLLYSTIGYLILGIKTPKIVGASQTTFMGMYIMSITFGCLFIVCSIIITIIAVMYFKHKKKETKN